MTNLTLHHFGHDEKQSIQKLAVYDLFVHFLWECYQAGVDHLLRLVFGVSKIVVEVHDLLQQHQHVL